MRNIHPILLSLAFASLYLTGCGDSSSSGSKKGEILMERFENSLKEERFQDALALVQQGNTLAEYSHPTSGRNALGLAVGYDQIEIVRLLLEQGADPSKVISNNLSLPIFSAGNVEMFKVLVEAGSPLRHESSTNTSALLKAVSNRDLESVRYLVEQGADVNFLGLNLETPLDVARLRAEPEIVDLLKSKGAKGFFDDDFDPDLYNKLKGAVIFKELAEVKALLEAGAPAHERLVYNAIRKSPEKVQLLLDHGASISHYSLKRAIGAVPVELFARMVERAEDKNPVGPSMGWTLADTIIVKNKPAYLKVLLEAGLDPKSKSKLTNANDMTLIEVAEDRDATEIAELLREYATN